MTTEQGIAPKNDPEFLLSDLRHLTDELLTEGGDGMAKFVARRFRYLDELLSRGGPLPQAWLRGVDTETFILQTWLCWEGSGHEICDKAECMCPCHVGGYSEDK